MRQVTSILPLGVDSLVFEAGGRRLIDGMSLSIAKGGLTALIGPNGAGKSLLLRLCHGLLVPSSGTIRWNVPGGSAAGHKRHAMVFQHPVMLRRSVRGNIEHALRASGFSRAEAARKSDVALARFGLAALSDGPARTLSGGEKQRLAIARAWAMHPEVIFLDEPTSQLDPGATRQIEAVLADLIAEGVTLVMATHDLGQARRLASHILFLSRGRIVEAAPAERFFPTPQTEAARAFLAGDLIW